MIAQANALEGRVALVEGSTLQLPQVSRSANGFGTYAPANPAEAIGSTVPQAVPPPPPSRGCGTIGLIIMIVVAVVVTAITAAAAAPAIAQALGVGVNAGISALAGAVGAAAGSIESGAALPELRALRRRRDGSASRANRSPARNRRAPVQSRSSNGAGVEEAWRLESWIA